MSNRANSRTRRPVMMAVVLGTALAALGMDRLSAADLPPQAVGDIGRYCTSCWRNARLPTDAWGDCTQAVFERLLERVPTTKWELALKGEGDERREFLRAIDAVKKRTQRAKRFVGDVETVSDVRLAERGRLDEDREAVRLAANRLLTPRQQRILQMSFEGASVHQIGDELCLAVERVSDEKYKAIRKLRAHLAERDV